MAIRAAEDGGLSTHLDAPGAVLGAGPSRPAWTPAHALTTSLPAPSSLTYPARRKQPVTMRAAEDGGPSNLHSGDCVRNQSCLLKSQMAGTRKATPNPAITAMLVPIGCRVRSWRIAAGRLSRSATKRSGSIP